MTVRLIGRRTSSNVQKVLWALEEVGIAYEVEERGGKFGRLDEPSFLALNPNGLVPVLIDGGLTLWESNAIVRYLSARYASGLLWPVEPEDRAKVDQWTDWAGTTFQPAWISVFWKAVRTPEDKRDPQAIAEAVTEASRLFAILDQQLAKTPFVAGDSFTYADIVTGVCLYRWTTMDIERPVLPHVAEWHQKLLARPAFVKTINVSYEDLVGRSTP